MITEEAVRNWDIKKMSFPEDIKSRGLDSSTLPKFPYRDDAQMIWDVLGEYVAAYLQHFYPTDDLLQQNAEVQAFAAEVADHGMRQGFPASIQTVSELAELITCYIMMAGPFHSAMNYPQYEYEALASNMPFASYVDPEELAKKDTITRKDILDMLPPWRAAATSRSVSCMKEPCEVVTTCTQCSSFRALHQPPVRLGLDPQHVGSYRRRCYCFAGHN